MSAPETGNWRNRGIRDKKRNECHNVIYGNNQRKTHNWDKSIDTLLWKPVKMVLPVTAAWRALEGGRGAVNARYPLLPKQLN